ncbi:hypothetical protein QFC22_001165 [Naganishia vaughanmartiniae]|uniref:Uncharacterized protein n=1 Tax=Naganishia vaughanmartiniae TaxID=1424756 RepID=A0ACC2XLV1_9TREE|nr:hypothetical protein QFC22_001165 [Naganishia vaughanmartiniae]
MSTENLAEAFGRPMQGNDEGVASVSTNSDLPRTSSPGVVHPEPLPFRRSQALSRLTGTREETRSVDHSREPIPHLLRPTLPLQSALRTVSRNRRNVRMMAFARAKTLIDAHLAAVSAATSTLNAKRTQRAMLQDQPRRVQSAGPVLGRRQELEPETMPKSEDEEDEWVDHDSEKDAGEAMPNEMPDTSVTLTAGDGVLIYVHDYNILRDASFLRRLLPLIVYTDPPRSLKFALMRGTMEGIASAALRHFTLDIADSCGVAFWHNVSRARARWQGLEEDEALEWQARAHYVFVRCVYEGPLQIFRCPEAKSKGWKGVADVFLEDMTGFEALQALVRGNDTVDETTPILEASPQFGYGYQEMQEMSQLAFAYPEGAPDRYFLPTQRELIKHVKPVSVMSRDFSLNHFNLHREGYSGIEQLGFLTGSPNRDSQGSDVMMFGIEGVPYKVAVNKLSRNSPAFRALIDISPPDAQIQVPLPASVLHFIIQVMWDTPEALTADSIMYFADGELSHASPLHALCHLYEIGVGYQIPKLVHYANKHLPGHAWQHPALALAEAMQQVPYHQLLADAALRCFDLRLADMCSFHFWRRISYSQSLKIHEVFFEEFKWQRSTHLRFLLAIYSEKPQGGPDAYSLAGVDWDRISHRFLESMRFETAGTRRTDAPQTSEGGPSGTTARH